MCCLRLQRYSNRISNLVNLICSACYCIIIYEKECIITYFVSKKKKIEMDRNTNETKTKDMNASIQIKQVDFLKCSEFTIKYLTEKIAT